jgi:hypothetical protein
MRSLKGCLLVAALALACGRQPAGPPSVPDPSWVTAYHPRLAWTGYTLTLHQARVPVLLDMNGRTVHSWPEARVKSRVRLLPDGSILGLGLGREVVEYDWEGRKTWEFRTPGAIPHHDVIRLANGNTLVVMFREGEPADTFLEVDRSGKVVWTWRALDHLGDLLPADPDHPHDLTHINSVQEIPQNPWFAAGDRRFRPGNLLVSARNLSTIFIVDRPGGAIVWSFRDGLSMQHEALMNGPGLPEPGLIQVFNNRPRSFATDRQSELLEIDPRSNAVVWRYRAPGFFSPTGGVLQMLPNGNRLVTSTRGGRIFEITPQGALAWQWVSPRYEPVRAVRVATDACPQLAKLPAQVATAVVPRRGDLHVDGECFRFARRGSRTRQAIDGTKRFVLKDETDCRDLVLPADATVRVGYGVDRKRLRAAGRAQTPPEFTVRIRPIGAKADTVLLRETVGLDGPSWRVKTLPLDRFGLQPVRFCVQVDDGMTAAATPRQRFAYWEQPWIASPRQRARMDLDDDGDDVDDDGAPTGDLTPEELEVRRKHLKALGYAG